MMINRGGGLRSLATSALLLGLVSHSQAAQADCKKAAEEELASFPNTITLQATLSSDADLTGKPVSAKANCVDGKDCVVVFFHHGTKPTAPPPEPGDGFVAVAKRWQAVAQFPSAKDCRNLFEYRFEKKAGVSRADPPTPPPPPTERAFAESKTTLLEATTADAALDALKKSRVRYTSPTAAGAAHGAFDDAAGETLQILGQIVVDRASNKGYALLQARLKTALKCADGKDFPKSCAVLDALRIQDIAMAPEALAKALAQDLLELVKQHAEAPLSAAAAGGKASGDSPAARADEAELREALFELALSLITSSGLSRELALRNAISQVTLYATQKADVAKLPAAQQAAVLGALTFARCIALNTDGTSKALANCNVEAELDALNPPEPKAKPAALELAQQLVALGATENASTASARLALETVAATACMVLQNAPQPKLECASIESAKTLDDATRVAFAGAFADALLDKDAATFVVVAAKLVDLKWAADEDQRKNKRSALRLLTGVLNYAATYGDESEGSSGNDKHAQRTKILESLTKDMTDRAGRGGDCIWSLGGALRVEGGARVATHGKNGTFYGPLGLPLGLAFDTVPEASNGWGFHLQLDAVNLGNYLALDNGPKVKKPELGDVFAPGLTLGAGYGQDLPVVVGAFFSYTPQFVVDPGELDKNGEAKRGSINFGATVGIHVPLLDMN